MRSGVHAKWQLACSQQGSLGTCKLGWVQLEGLVGERWPPKGGERVNVWASFLWKRPSAAGYRRPPSCLTITRFRMYLARVEHVGMTCRTYCYVSLPVASLFGDEFAYGRHLPDQRLSLSRRVFKKCPRRVGLKLEVF